MDGVTDAAMWNNPASMTSARQFVQTARRLLLNMTNRRVAASAPSRMDIAATVSKYIGLSVPAAEIGGKPLF